MNIARSSLSAIAVLLIQSQIGFAQEISLDSEVAKTIHIEKKSRYSKTVSDRPFTLPENVLELQVTTKMGGSTWKTSSVGLQVAFGVTDDFEVRAGYDGIRFSGLEPAKDVTIGVGYFLYATPYVASMLDISAPVHFDGSNLFRSVSLAMPMSFSVVPGIVSVSTFTSDLVKLSFAPNSKVEATFEIPFNISVQATNALWFKLGTTLANFTTNSDNKHQYIWNKSPVHLTGLYAFSDAVDVFAKAGFSDAHHANNSFAASVGFNIRMGALEG